MSSTMFCRDVVRAILDLPQGWDPMGAVAVGHAVEASKERAPRDSEEFIEVRRAAGGREAGREKAGAPVRFARGHRPFGGSGPQSCCSSHWVRASSELVRMSFQSSSIVKSE